ncbi:hypothetical protein BDV36DRAFT_64132 [Aspergillus pseudocaelatus]|uniref:Uncharacterized protein n=1 Tax=Aspergillus pseudocaelatus TaxID=1825620 RepID=A0ABQ6W5C2_9EURO|nr:hypothetical protein BDV36DRAFT_64132 [Aspergillus pseudocaelatus]
MNSSANCNCPDPGYRQCSLDKSGCSPGLVRGYILNLLLRHRQLLPIKKVGEKFIDWPDGPLLLDTILESVSLYCSTGTSPESFGGIPSGHSPLMSSNPELLSLKGKDIVVTGVSNPRSMYRLRSRPRMRRNGRLDHLFVASV